jgi:hypothetical protein
MNANIALTMVFEDRGSMSLFEIPNRIQQASTIQQDRRPFVFTSESPQQGHRIAIPKLVHERVIPT